MATTEVKVPDIGDFKDVEVIEVHVKAGDRLAAEEPMITLESDKASMEVPAPAAGTVNEVKVKAGDRVSEGHLILVLETEAAEAAKPAAPKEAKPEPPRDKEEPKSAAAAAAAKPGAGDIQAELLVLGSGPGGYTAAFRAADLGLKVVLVERYPTLGGVCLNVGCIPSKALLHAAKVIAEAREMGEHGLKFGKPEIDLDKLADWKDGVVGRLTGGLAGLARQRKVQVVQGVGTFTSPNQLEVATDSGKKTISFGQAIIAAGSAPVFLPFIPRDDRRVMDSTGALELDDIPKRLLVLGGGIIGLEMATVYHELGSKITVVELMDQLIPGADPDIIRPLHKRIEQLYENIFLSTKVTDVKATKAGLEVTFEGQKAPKSDVFDKVLVAVGRRPNGKGIGADAAGVTVDERGFIRVDRQQRTNVAHIFAIGDVVGQPMLAHKATHEAKVAAEVAAGHKASFDAEMHPLGRLHRPRGRLGRPDRDRGQGERGQVRQGQLPLGGLRPGARHRAPRGPDQAPVRRGERPPPRRRHRRRERGRPDRGSSARDRDGRRRRRHRPHDPPPPDALGDDRLLGRSVRRHPHRPLPAQAALGSGDRNPAVAGRRSFDSL